METRQKPNRTGFSPRRLGLYLLVIVIVIVTASFIRSITHSQADLVNDEIKVLEIRLAKALEPVPDPPPDLEDWMFSEAW